MRKHKDSGDIFHFGLTWLGSFAKNKPYGMALYHSDSLSLSLSVCVVVAVVAHTSVLNTVITHTIIALNGVWVSVYVQLNSFSCANSRTHKEQKHRRDCVENHVNLFKLHRQTKPTPFAMKPFQTQTIRSQYAHTAHTHTGSLQSLFFALAKFICTAHGAKRAFILYCVEKWSTSHNSHIEIGKRKSEQAKKNMRINCLLFN